MIDIDDPEIAVRARRLNARAEVRDVRLLKSSVEMSQLPTAANSLSYDLNSFPEVQHTPGDEFFVVQISYNLTINEASDTASLKSEAAESEQDHSADPAVARADFALAALFTLSMREGDDSPSNIEFEAYSSTTAQLVMYPYAREYIYDITGRLGLPALTIGMLKMTAGKD